MIERDIRQIEIILAETCFIAKNIAGIAEKDFLSDDLLQHAVSMSLITIGECANHLSDDFKEMHCGIEWQKIVSVRNIAAHGYWQLDMRQIWQAVVFDIPELRKYIEQSIFLTKK